MDGKGKAGPRVVYFDEDIALTQKLTRPKLPPLPAGPDVAPPLQPKQGGAVDVEALRRIRRVSAPNMLAIRMPGESGASDGERTVAQSTSEGTPSSGSAPSTIPEELAASTRRAPEPERSLAPLVTSDDDEETDSQTSPGGGFSDGMVTRQVSPEVARLLLSQAAAMDVANVRASMGGGGAPPSRDDDFAKTLAVGESAPQPPRVAPVAPVARVVPKPPAPRPASPDPVDSRDPAQTLASLPKPAREVRGFETLPLGSNTAQAAMPSVEMPARATPPAASPASVTFASPSGAAPSSFGGTQMMPSQLAPFPLVTAPPATPDGTVPMPAFGAPGGPVPMPSFGASGPPTLGASGVGPQPLSMGGPQPLSMGPQPLSMGGPQPLSMGGPQPLSMGMGGPMSASGGFAEPPPPSMGPMSMGGGVMAPPQSPFLESAIASPTPAKRSLAWLWVLLALLLVGLVAGGGLLAKRRNPQWFSLPHKVG